MGFASRNTRRTGGGPLTSRPRLPRTPLMGPQGDAARRRAGGAHPGAQQAATEARGCGRQAGAHGPHRFTPDGSTLVEHTLAHSR